MVRFSACGRLVAPAPFVYNTALPLRNCFHTFVRAQLVYLGSGLPVGVRVHTTELPQESQQKWSESSRFTLLDQQC